MPFFVHFAQRGEPWSHFILRFVHWRQLSVRMSVLNWSPRSYLAKSIFHWEILYIDDTEGRREYGG